MPTLDIVTPTLNSEKYILATISSLNLSGSVSLKHIIVDSYSSDSTLNIARACGSNVLQFPPGNMYSAINYGLRSGSAEWCAYINSDDLIYADSYFNALYSLGETADIIYGNADYVDSIGRLLHYWNSPSPLYLKYLLRSKTLPFPQPTMIFRRCVFEQLGGFNDRYSYSADFDFVLRAHVAGFCFQKYCGGPMAAFRLHPGQFSASKAKEMRNESLASLRLNLSCKPSRMKELFFIVLFLRIINIDSYISRALRARFLGSKHLFPRSMNNN